MKNRLGAVLRGVLVVLMGLTMVMTLLGAVGTSCVAWNADKYGKAFALFVPYMPTYQVLVYVSLVAAVAMTLVTYAIVRGDRWFYIGALLALLVGGGAAATQMYYTSSLKQVSFFATPPTNIRFYLTALTLILFLLVRIPGVWNKAGLGRPATGTGSYTAPTGLALFLAGVLILTTPVWAGPSHMLDGYNLVYTLEVPLLIDGIAMTMGGLILLVFGSRLVSLVRRERPRSVSAE